MEKINITLPIEELTIDYEAILPFTDNICKLGILQ